MLTQAMYLAHGFAHCMSITLVVTAVGVLTASLLAAQTYKLVLGQYLSDGCFRDCKTLL